MYAFALMLAAAIPVPVAEVLDEPTTLPAPATSAEFTSTRDDIVRKLEESRFERRLRSPGVGATSGPEFEALSERIDKFRTIDGVSKGAPGVKYDVILQPGHFGRTTGATGAEGKRVSERELVAFVTAETANRLRSMKYNVLVVNADDHIRDIASTDAYEGLSARVFLAVHADGSVSPCSTGPSLGYARGTSPFAMHAIGWAVSKALGYRYKEFRPDGFTANMAQYYMFGRVRTDEMSGLLEIGEVTCDATEAKLIENSTRLGGNIASAVDFILKQ